MRSTLAGRRRLLHTRARAALRSARGAFDLPSIIAGVVVVGILTAGVLAAIFGVIPFAQDNGAKQDLSSVRTAEGVAKAKDGRFLDSSGLDAAGYISKPLAAGTVGAEELERVADVSPSKPLAVETDADGTCYVSVVLSPTGRLYAGTSSRPDPFAVTSPTDITECLTADAMADLFASLPAHSTPAPPAVTPLAAPASVTVTATAATSADFSWAAVSGATGYQVQSRINGGSWASAGSAQTGTTVRVSGSTGDIVDVRVAALKGSETSVYSAPGTATLSIPTGGSLAAWGSYQHGEVGIDASPYNSSSTGTALVPVNAAPSLTGQAISALDAGTKPCVLTDGTVSCWGFNAIGSTFYTGTGSSATSVYTPQPLSTTGGMANKAVTKLDSGSGASCAIENGDIYCWGTTNGWGGITGSTSSTKWPVAAWPGNTVLQGKKFSDVVVGTDNVCAISAGKAYCWGDVRFGANGAGTTTQPYSSQNWVSPAAVVDTGVLKDRTVTALSIGANHTCAIADGAVFCWGNNNYGQLGSGNLNPTSVPLAVDTSGVLAGKTVTAVTAGVYSTCVIADGDAYCWGQNSNGTLGNGGTAVSSVPTAVSTAGVLADKTVSAISTNGNTTCVIADSAAYCWGLNNYGNLGNGTMAASTTPVAVDTGGALKGKKLLGISVGNSATFALIA